MLYDTNWFIIPGFSWYDINKETGQIRSHKHYKSDAFHIMSINKKDGRVTLVDDYGVTKKKKPTDLYNLTFNSDNPLMPAPENVRRAGGMFKVNRNMDSNINILNGTYTPIQDNTQDEGILPDFGIRIKPFTVGI